MQEARSAGVLVSYDINYRPSLWKEFGGLSRAREVNRELASMVDVMIGNEFHIASILGSTKEEESADFRSYDPSRFQEVARACCEQFSSIQVIASTFRVEHSATCHDWAASLFSQGELIEAPAMEKLEVMDRIGGGDSFASGLLAGMLQGRSLDECLRMGLAHGALAMTTPGDTSMATSEEVYALAFGENAAATRR